MATCFGGMGNVPVLLNSSHLGNAALEGISEEVSHQIALR